MPETQEIVINTGPLIALIAGLNDLSFLRALYNRVLVPFEVCQEIESGGVSGFGVEEFKKSNFINKKAAPLTIVTFCRTKLTHCINWIKAIKSGLFRVLNQSFIPRKSNFKENKKLVGASRGPKLINLSC